MSAVTSFHLRESLLQKPVLTFDSEVYFEHLAGFLCLSFLNSLSSLTFVGGRRGLWCLRLLWGPVWGIICSQVQFSGLCLFITKPCPCYRGSPSFRNELLHLSWPIPLLFRAVWFCLTFTRHVGIHVSACIHVLGWLQTVIQIMKKSCR